jgi:hypothetical protein
VALDVRGWHEEVNHFPFLDALFPPSANASDSAATEVSPLYAIITFNPDFGFEVGQFDVE